MFDTRYSRQMLLPEMGAAKQQKLAQARVLVAGAGGLGCPVIQYLAAAGVGHIGIADADTVELTNLNRQTLYTPAQVGVSKARLAVQWVQAFNPHISCTAYETALTQYNVPDILPNYHLLIDATDNFTARYLLNDAAVLLNKPLVYGAVYRFQGQIAVFNLPLPDGSFSANYRHLYPTPPHQTPNCADAGVLGIVPGIIGALQANEALKIITGIGQPLFNKVCYYNALLHQTYTVAIQPHNRFSNAAPKTMQELQNFNYVQFCQNTTPQTIHNITPKQFTQHLNRPKTLIIDVRNPHEEPHLTHFKHIRVPLSQLPHSLPSLDNYNTVITFCQTGERSHMAAQIISQTFPEITVYSLAGGISGIL
ncbi:MAG TPA: HesA/MoeB/ThiF family protein [Chitinophagales bacterium]|nr:HesA/MoeB/ThiF family protein [Chitinophagales bacterium]HRK29222.1 HesA/MoeB/ThiF family protein [Chitinophagales bacterium]